MLKLIAPFRVLLSLDNSLIAARPSYFLEFLNTLGKEMDNPDSPFRKHVPPSLHIGVNVSAELSESDIKTRYLSVNSHGSLYLFPRLLSMHFRQEAMKELEIIYHRAARKANDVASAYSMHFIPDLGSFRIDIQDNTIAVLSLDLMVDRSQINKNDHAWDRLDEWTTALIHFLLQQLYPDYVFPLLDALKIFSRHAGYPFIQPISEYTLFSDLVGDTENPHQDLHKRFMLMWVNRTLCYNGDYPENHWIRQFRHSGETLKIRESEAHLNAGNSVIVMPPETDLSHFVQLWDVLVSAQYYYASLDIVNINLVKYIGTTFTRQTSKNLRRLSREMETIINKITILQVRYHDYSMELQGMAKKIFHVLQKEWDFAVLANNVNRKLELCKSNITVLNQETNNRNQGRTEIVLISLTGMGILNLFVELGNYATQMPPEHMYMVGKIPGFMDLGFIMSGNALSWVGIIISIAVVVFTILNRRG